MPNLGDIIGGASLITGLIGSIAGMSGERRSEDWFDFDPDNLALNAFKDLGDANSASSKRISRESRTIAEDAGPSLDALLGYNAAQGIIGGSLATRQAEAQSVRAREAGLRAFQQYMIQNEANRARYLGMYYDKERFKKSGVLEQDRYDQETSSSFFEQFTKGGLGLFAAKELFK